MKHEKVNKKEKKHTHTLFKQAKPRGSSITLTTKPQCPGRSLKKVLLSTSHFDVKHRNRSSWCTLLQIRNNIFPAHTTTLKTKTNFEYLNIFTLEGVSPKHPFSVTFCLWTIRPKLTEKPLF